MLYRKIIYLGITVLFSLAAGTAAHAQESLLNVSYDVSRELYKDINPAFTSWWQTQGHPAVTVNQSHAFSVEEKLGGWDAVKQKHFADGALFDQIMVNR